MKILYIGAKLPSRTETFVYREIFALRDKGVDVEVASVHHPEEDLGEDRLSDLAAEAIPIYSTGVTRMLMDVGKHFARRPLRTTKTISLGCQDLLFGKEVPFQRRLKLAWQCLAGISLAERCKNRNLQHIHAHMAHVPTTIGMYAAKCLGIPFSFTGHAADLFRDYSLLPAKLERARFISCISDWHREYYQGKAPNMDAKKLHVVRCGVDLKEFAPVANQSESRSLHIVGVGRLVEKKGFDTLVEACQLLHQKNVAFRCTIVGDGPEYETLFNQIRNEGLENQIRLTGSMPNREIQKILNDADVFVLPCKPASSGDKDGIPVVLMEAMACQLPVISGDITTIRELVIHDETGMMVEPGNADDLAIKIIDLVENCEKRIKLGRKGRSRIENEFSIGTNADRLLNAFNARGAAEAEEAGHPKINHG